MSTGQQRSALAALDLARPAVSRLDANRHDEDNAADLIEAWKATETALRTVVGGSSLSGQALIRELRQRELLSLDQAHALVDFAVAADRSLDTKYCPTPADLSAARAGLQQLEAALTGAPTPMPGPAAVPPRAANAPRTPPAVGVPPQPSDVVVPAPGHRPRGVPSAVIFALIAGLAIASAAAAWYFLGNRGAGSALERGRAAYAAGNRTVARNEFAAAARENPALAEPHIYLGRMAREEHEMETARQELTRAVELEANNSIALREMGAFLLASGNLDLARRFYVRAIQANQADSSAMGFLGCTLVRMGRYDEGQRWMQRAGQGPWSSCATSLPPPGTQPSSPAAGAPPRIP